MERFIVSARKYRPDSFESVIGQSNIAATLQNSIVRGQLAHAYLFCGPRGVGKTTSARIFAKTINCLNPTDKMEACGVCESCVSFAEGRSYCIHELDAASNNSVDDIRLLNEKVRIPPQIGKYSVFIIDEVHMLSQAAFNAFLKTLEEPPAHAIFILATTKKHKIIPTILSRCQTYDFSRISVEDIVSNLKNISEKEGITADSDSLHIIAQKADGAMRDALTIFDQMVAFCGKELKYDQIIKNLNVLDYEYYFRVTEMILEGNYKEILMVFDEILSKGFNALHFIGGLSSHFRDLLMSKERETASLLEVSPTVAQRYRDQAEKCSTGLLFAALEITTSCESSYKISNNQRLHTEFSLIKLARIVSPASAPQIQAQAPAREAVTAQATTPSTEAAPAPEATPAPTPTPEATPAPAEQATKTSTMSIKNLLAKAEKDVNSTPVHVSREIGEEPFDLEKILKVWPELAENEKKTPRLASAILQNPPKYEGGNEIVFLVSNEAQKKWIEANCIQRMNSFLKFKLNNNSANLVVDIVHEDEQKENKLYMPEEKAKFLLENNPELRELQNDLKLEIK